MTEQNRVIRLYREGQFQAADHLCIRLQHDGVNSPVLRAMRGFNALHLGRPFRALAWLLPVKDELEPPIKGQAYINLCRAFGELNRYDEAVAAGKQAVSLAPKRPNAHLNLAAALVFVGQTDEGIKAMEPVYQAGLHDAARKIERLAGKDVPLWPGPNIQKAQKFFKTALTVFNAGNLTKAAQLFLQALQHHPEYYNAKLALVQISRMENDARSALMELDRVEAEHPDLQPAARGQVMAERARNLAGIEQYKEATAVAQKALPLLPEDADLWNALGFYQLKCRDLDQAARSLESALTYQPAHHLAMNNLASVYLDQENDTAAFQLYKTQLKKVPDSIPALVGMAHVCQARGDFDKVKAYLRRAMDIDPADPFVIRLAADADPSVVDDAMLDRWTRAGEQIDPKALCPPRKSSANAQLLFALAQIYAARKDYDQAQTWLFRANQIQSRARPYQPGQHERLKDRLQQVFAHNDVLRCIHEKTDSPFDTVPVFVLGMPRSGSTLLERILNSHTAVATGGEMKDLNLQLETTDSWRHLRSAGHDWLTWTLATLDQPDMDAAARRYGNALSRVDKQATYVIDKMPGNFWWIGFILRMFPHAVILHTCRDAKATCLSCFQQNFSEGQTFSFTPEGLRHYHGLYAHMMQFWHTQFPGRILDVRLKCW